MNPFKTTKNVQKVPLCPASGLPVAKCRVCVCTCSYSREEVQQAEVLYYSQEKIKHNPWRLKCHQQLLQKLRDTTKLRNQHSILSP